MIYLLVLGSWQCLSDIQVELAGRFLEVKHGDATELSGLRSRFVIIQTEIIVEAKGLQDTDKQRHRKRVGELTKNRAFVNFYRSKKLIGRR